MPGLTKIIATLGPSCEKEEKIERLLKKGVNIFRFNLKHNTLDWHKKKINLVRKVSRKLKKTVGILADMEGGELRTGYFQKNKVIELKKGELVIFAKDVSFNADNVIPVPRIEEFFNLTKNQRIFVDDGRLEFQVKKIEKNKIFAKVVSGGILGEKKTINLPGFYHQSIKINLKQNLSALRFCSDLEVDFLAISFVREKKEILEYKKFFENKKNQPWIISKIETREAIENFNEILEVSEGIMVARGDLGVEAPMEKVPFYQKNIIEKCLVKGKPVIIATHLLESMTENPRPTRAEVSDVANSLYDLADGLMFSAETAYGKYPELAVATARKIANFVEKQRRSLGQEKIPVNFKIKTQPEAICLGAFHLYKSEFCQRQNIKAFVVLSRTGLTCRALSRLRPYLPIFVLTSNKHLVEKLAIIFGVHPFYLKFPHTKDIEVGIYQKKGPKEIEKILNFLKRNTFLKTGDKIILIYGEDWRTIPGRTSIMRVQEVV